MNSTHTHFRVFVGNVRFHFARASEASSQSAKPTKATPVSQVKDANKFYSIDDGFAWMECYVDHRFLNRKTCHSSKRELEKWKIYTLIHVRILLLCVRVSLSFLTYIIICNINILRDLRVSIRRIKIEIQQTNPYCSLTQIYVPHTLKVVARKRAALSWIL